MYFALLSQKVSAQGVIEKYPGVLRILLSCKALKYLLSGQSRAMETGTALFGLKHL